MASVRDRYRTLLGSGENTDRIQFFSDAVFAIAMTLLVIDLRVPEVPEGQSLLAPEVLQDQLPSLFAYALSFGIIAVNWMSHHRKFRVIHRWNGRLIQLNFVLLFLVTFVPFPTALIAETDPEFASVALYAFVVGALTISQLGVWVYAWRAGFVSDQVDAQLFRYVAYMMIPVPAVFWSSILIAIWQPVWAMWWWLALIPGSLISRALMRRAGDATALPQSKSSESLRSSDDSRS